MMYRVKLKLVMPLSDADIRDFLRINGGPAFAGEIDADAFKEKTKSYDELEMISMPMDLEKATMLKMRFGGTITKI